ncbi:MAG: hypothetical protein GF308_05995 [Candidatus Heimdallarchaeota archaeon]|nr:hypothetical protein [Candidatus Heimdallarchaeota archaeon]
MVVKLRKFTNLVFLIAVMIFPLFLTNTNLFYQFTGLTITQGNYPENNIVLGPLEYHIVSVNATKGELISGDWAATPADVISPPFLVFICDSASLKDWETSSNLTQAAYRIPSEGMIYFYDPLLRVDDIPLDNKRSGSFQIKAPSTDTWNLVLYAGTTVIPLTFSWHMSLIEGYLYDYVLYGILAVLGITTAIILLIVFIKRRRKRSPEDEIEQLLKEGEKQKRKTALPSHALGSLEEDEDEESLEKFYRLKERRE